MSVWSSAFSRPWSCTVVRRSADPSGGAPARAAARGRGRRAFQCSTASAVSSSSTCPTASSRRAEARAPRGTRGPPRRGTRRTFSTNSGLPVNRSRSTGFWVAMPTGQVSRWQTRIMTQPETTSGAVAKPNSSAPSSAATTTSRPVLSWPSTWTTIRSRSPLSSSVCCVSARPSSHGRAGVLERGQRRARRCRRRGRRSGRRRRAPC